MNSLEIARQRIAEAKERRSTELDLRELGLTVLPGEMFDLTWLTSLHLKGNQFNFTGAMAIARGLPNLTSLDLSGNRIGAVGARSIGRHLRGLTSLDLGHSGIGDGGVRAIARGLPNLISLGLEDNKIGDEGVGAIAEYLKGLTSLDLRFNQIGNGGVRAIAKYLRGHLTSLHLGFNQIGDEGVRAIAQGLPNLTSLDLGGNQIGDEGVRAIAQGLPNLTSLDLLNSRIGDGGVQAIAEHLPGLTSLNLGNNKIRDEGARTIAQGLPNLTFLNLASNRIGNAGALAIATHLPNLTSLHLLENQIGDDGAQALYGAPFAKTLIWLSLKNNNINFLSKESLETHDAQAIFAAMRGYFKGKEAGTLQQLNEAKLIIVGEEAVGKTSLVRYLVDGQPRRESEPQTIGTNIRGEINTKSWHPEGQSSQGSVKLNVWDFGGQEIFHGIHRYFLTERSLYLLVLDGRKKDDMSVYKWLKVIRNIGKESPVLIVINKSIGENSEQSLELNENDLKVQYSNIVGFLKTSCNDNQSSMKSIQRLKDAILETLYNSEQEYLKHIFEKHPASHIRIKNEVSNEAKNNKILKRDRFKEICETGESPVTDENEQRYLLRLLHDLGVVVAHGFDRDATYITKEISLLDPNWLTDAIYRILIETRNLDKHGEFSRSDLHKWLDEALYPEQSHDFILTLMQHEDVGLCFELPCKNRFMVPEALSKNSPDYENWPQFLLFRYRYDFLPRNLLPRFMVQAQSLYKPDAYRWLTGVVLNVSGCKALVTANLEKNFIEIKIDAQKNENRARSALEVICHFLESVHLLNPEIQPKAFVPLPHNPDREVDYAKLLKTEQRKGPDFNADYDPDADMSYTVGELLNGVGKNLLKDDPAIYAKARIHLRGDGNTINFGDVTGSQISNNIEKSYSKKAQENASNTADHNHWLKNGLLIGACCAFLSYLMIILPDEWKFKIGIPILIGALVTAIVIAFNPKYFYRRQISIVVAALTGLSVVGQGAIAILEYYIPAIKGLVHISPYSWPLVIVLALLLLADYFVQRNERSSFFRK